MSVGLLNNSFVKAELAGATIANSWATITGLALMVLRSQNYNAFFYCLKQVGISSNSSCQSPTLPPVSISFFFAIYYGYWCSEHYNRFKKPGHFKVSDSTVQADWCQSFTDTVGTYQHFEWPVGTGEGKSDFLEFEDVGMNRRVQVTGLDLGGLSACFITLRAWKLDGRCIELSMKAHA